MSLYNRSYALFTLSVMAMLSACSTPNDKFPSLERRAYETNAPVAKATIPAIQLPTKLSPALQSSVDALVARHKAANNKFAAGLNAMQSTAAGAAGSSPGSEKWVNAHLQLSRLDKLRADSVAALGEIDVLIAGQIDGDSRYVTLLVEIQQDIAEVVTVQRAEIDRMSRQIGE